MIPNALLRLATSVVLLVPCHSLLRAQGPAPAPTAESRVPDRPTFTEHVAPILYEHCASCHRPGEIGPFALLSYEDAKKRAHTIERVTKSRYMPPWHPEEGWGDFHDARRLSDREIAVIEKWVASGMTEGSKAALPGLPRFVDGWQLGEPDLVLEMAESFVVPASGPDIYRNFVLPLELDEDKWIEAIEVRPSSRSVLHHTLIFEDKTGEAERLEAQDRSGQPGFKKMNFRGSSQVGAWAVGGTPRRLPDGLARPLSRSAVIVLSSHFHPSGKEDAEKTKIGLFFAKKAPARTLIDFQVPPQYGALWGIEIPAGRSDYVVEDRFVVPCDIELVGAWGHAHYLCTSMKASAKLPNGEVVKLISIPKWDFDWQNAYFYKQPVALPKGSVIEATLHYDNSASNASNPFDPPRDVRWGLQSTDEMGSLIFTCVTAKEKDVALFQSGEREEMRASAVRGARRRVVARYDQNADGIVKREEVPARLWVMVSRFDANGNGTFEDSEVDELVKALGGRNGRRRR